MKGIEITKKEIPILKNDERMYVYLQGNHFQQNNVLTSNNDHVINTNVINIYIVYKLDTIASSRNTTFTIQNALFGAMQITKNADNSKNNYKGYGICFDERSEFGHTIAEGGFTRLIEQIIFMLWVQALHKVFMILRYIQKITFTETLQISVKKFVLSLHYNGNNSYLFVNGRQE